MKSLKRQRLFTFGHPSPDAVINRYLTGKEEESAGDQQFDFVQQSNEYYSQICRELEVEKKNKEIIDESKMVNGSSNNNGGGGFWWNEATDDMGIEELEKFVCALEELKKKVNMRFDELSMINGSSSLPPSTSTMNQAIDYCASVLPFDFNYPRNTPF